MFYITAAFRDLILYYSSNMPRCLEKWSQTSCCVIVFVVYLRAGRDGREDTTQLWSSITTFPTFYGQILQSWLHYVNIADSQVAQVQDQECSTCPCCSIGLPCWAAKQDVLLSFHRTLWLSALDKAKTFTLSELPWKWKHFVLVVLALSVFYSQNWSVNIEFKIDAVEF